MAPDFDFTSGAEADLKGVLRSDFFHGYASSSAQVEAARDADGTGESICDYFARTQSHKIADQSTPSDTVRGYEFYKEDVALMKSYGVNAYRFSLSWPRIIPLGGVDDPINESGIAHYNSLIDELLANNITPFVTLFHWDLPQALEDRYRGFLSQDAYTKDFLRYARLCFERFGDRVKYWITYNEPGAFALAGYADGMHPPGRSSDRKSSAEGDTSTEPWIAGHTQIVSHARVVEMYQAEFQPTQKGAIGITLSGNWHEPWDASSPHDISAAQRALEFQIGWFSEPIFGSGDYPASMREQLGDRLPKFTEEEKMVVRGSSEFYGLNTYTSFFTKDRYVLGEKPEIDNYKGNVTNFDENKIGVSRGQESDTIWVRTAPWGFRKLLLWSLVRYRLPIYVFENGTTAKGEHEWKPESKNDVLVDTHRVDYFRGYISEMVQSVKNDGVDVRAYFAWTLMDNWEWESGFTDRFGVTWVDHETEEKTRYPKRSAWFLKEFWEFLVKK